MGGACAGNPQKKDQRLADKKPGDLKIPENPAANANAQKDVKKTLEAKKVEEMNKAGANIQNKANGIKASQTSDIKPEVVKSVMEQRETLARLLMEGSSIAPTMVIPTLPN